MKNLILILSLLLAPSAFADDAVTSFGWNSVTGTFQAMTRALGWKQIPDHDYGSFNITASAAAWSGGQVATIRYVRVGKQVTLHFPQVANTCSASTINFPAGSVPTALRVPSEYTAAIWISDSSAAQSTPGMLDVLSDGTIIIAKTRASLNFTASGTCGFYSYDATYSLQ